MIRNISIIIAIFALAMIACENGMDGGADESAKIDPTVTWPQGLSGLRGQTLADVSLAKYANNGTPGAFSWTTPNHSVGNDLGAAHSHSMTFTPTDKATYHTVTHDVAVSVSLIDMVHISGGTFTMGSPPDEPGRATTEVRFNVTVRDDFYIGKYEVTQAQWREVMGLTIQEQQVLRTTEIVTDYGKGDNRPVYYVSFYDTLVFCNLLSVMEGLDPAYMIDDETDPDWWFEPSALWNSVEIVEGSNGYRLPNEMQWEYACRAGESTPWYGTETESDRTDPLDDYAWYSAWWYKEDNSLQFTQVQPVGTKKPNNWGLYDMHGNVSEWCWDLWGKYPAYTDPYNLWAEGPNRVVRGGGWNSTAANLRSASRPGAAPGSSYNYVGFRVSRPVQ